MDGTWDLTGLYRALEDPAIEKDKLSASQLAGKLKVNPGRTSLRRRFSQLTEKLSAYAYLLASVNLGNQKVLNFSKNLQEYITGLSQRLPAASDEAGNPAVCLEYDRLLNLENLRPGYTKQLYHGDEGVRREAFRALEKGGLKFGDTVTGLYNQHLSHGADSRGITDTMAAREQAAAENGFSVEEIDTFISAVEGNTALPGFFYQKKARFLGKEQIDPWDIFAPTLPERNISWDQARRYALGTADALGADAGAAASRFFKNRWIDYSIRPEKRGGAFTHPGFSSHHPYIFLNFSGSLRDTMTLIHELFHGIHFSMARGGTRDGIMPTVAQTEAVSSIGELMSRGVVDEPGIGFHLAEMTLLKIFRQVQLFRWEESASAVYRKRGHCSRKDLSRLWIERMNCFFGNGVPFPDSYRGFWIYVPHFFHFPMYGLNYALGTAAALVFMKVYRENPKKTGRLFRDFLSAGGNAALSEWITSLVPGHSLGEVTRECFDEIQSMIKSS